LYTEPNKITRDDRALAKPLARKFGFPTKLLAGVVQIARIAPIPKPEEGAQIMRAAEPMRAAIEDLLEPVARLQRAVYSRPLSPEVVDRNLSLPYLASATEPYRFDALIALQRLLARAADEAATVNPTDKVHDPRRAMIVAKMALAGHFWWDCRDSYPYGGFVTEEDGFQVTPNCGMEFVVDFVRLTDPDVTLEEMADCTRDMQDAIGMTDFIERQREEAAGEQAEVA